MANFSLKRETESGYNQWPFPFHNGLKYSFLSNLKFEDCSEMCIVFFAFFAYYFTCITNNKHHSLISKQLSYQVASSP